MEEIFIDKKYLKENPNHIFVFGDNTLRVGLGGAAILRNEPNTYGFITKKKPSHRDEDYYRPIEYNDVYKEELGILKFMIKDNPDKTYLISKLGAGLANKYKIFEKIIEPNIKNDLKEFKNVKFLW